MSPAKGYLICALGITVSAQILGAQQTRFPAFRVGQAQLPALWERSPIVAVGDLTDVSALGVETLDHLPAPIAESVHTLYWCQATFNAVAVIKGRLPDERRYVWGAIQPKCRLFYGDEKSYQQHTTRIWFIREEQGLLRPIYDGGSAHFYGLFTKWSDGPKLPPRQKLGVLLLSPTAVANNAQEFAGSLWNNADLACSLLGRVDCTNRIKTLASLGEPVLRRVACDYLHAQQGEECDAPRRQ